MKNYIYGAGGHGKVVWDALQKAGIKCDGFIDDNAQNQSVDFLVFSRSVLNQKNNDTLHLAIGSCKVREDLASRLYGFEFSSIYHPNSVVSSKAIVQQGAFIAAGSIIGPDAKIGTHTIINHNAVVDHDCHVADFCHIAPNVSLGGGVQVGLGVLVGAGAIILPGISIGNYAIIGAGAIVTKNVEPNTTVIGNPAHPSNSNSS